MYIPKIDDGLKILTDNEVNDFVAKTFGEYFKSTKGKLFPKSFGEENIRRVAESLYIFVTTPAKVEKYVDAKAIDSFKFLNSSLDSLAKNLNKDDFKYFSREFDNNVLDLVK